MCDTNIWFRKHKYFYAVRTEDDTYFSHNKKDLLSLLQSCKNINICKIKSPMYKVWRKMTSIVIGFNYCNSNPFTFSVWNIIIEYSVPSEIILKFHYHPWYHFMKTIDDNITPNISKDMEKCGKNRMEIGCSNIMCDCGIKESLIRFETLENNRKYQRNIT